MVNRRVDSGHCYPEGFDIMKIRFKCPKVPKVLKPNVSNWRTWLTNCILVLGGFLAGGLFATDPPKFVEGVMPAKRPAPIVMTKEVKTVAIDRAAAVACTATLAETQNLRNDVKQWCGPKPAAKAAVTK
jgi:hypothetical protein